MQDGGEENISFMNLHFNENPRETCYGSQKLVYPLATIFNTQKFLSQHEKAKKQHSQTSFFFIYLKQNTQNNVLVVRFQERRWPILYFGLYFTNEA